MGWQNRTSRPWTRAAPCAEAPGTLVVVVDGRIGAARNALVGWVPGCSTAAGRHAWCATWPGDPADADAVGALARLALMARQRGTPVGP